MSASSQKKLPFNHSPANGLAPQSTQRPRPVCTWSRAPQSESSPTPFARSGHTLTATATATPLSELFLFGGYVHGCASGDLYVLSTRDFSTTLLQTSGEVPVPRAGHGAALIGTTFLICGGKTDRGYQYVLNHDSLYLLSLGTSDLLISNPTPADHSFALQYRESGPASWSMVPDLVVVTTIPQPWSVLSSLSLVARSTAT